MLRWPCCSGAVPRGDRQFTFYASLALICSTPGQAPLGWQSAAARWPRLPCADCSSWLQKRSCAPSVSPKTHPVLGEVLSLLSLRSPSLCVHPGGVQHPSEHPRQAWVKRCGALGSHGSSEDPSDGGAGGRGALWDPSVPTPRSPRHPVHQVRLPAEERQPHGAQEPVRQRQEAQAHPPAVQPAGVLPACVSPPGWVGGWVGGWLGGWMGGWVVG